MWEDFKKFALKGNVVDMAVGVIVGGAFGKIVTSLVNDIIMPFFGWVTAGVQFKALKFVLSPAVMDGETVVSPEVAILYGNFIQNIVDFLIIAVSIFLVVRILNNLKKKEEPAPPAPEPPKGPSQEELLAEIRDLLKEQNK
ncbi:MAG: large-conductance mechanosensitive channel protein MscL [Oscillospiraceae bacterium]|nr:large-conductance mechanosensitive channel protein MscL [Oscillospiraceae bacterium]